MIIIIAIANDSKFQCYKRIRILLLLPIAIPIFLIRQKVKKRIAEKKNEKLFLLYNYGRKKVVIRKQLELDDINEMFISDNMQLLDN